MSVVSHGADTERLAHISGELERLAQQTSEVATAGSASLRLLVEAWQGPDTGHFGHSWGEACEHLLRLSDQLSTYSRELRRQAGDQDRTSSAGSRTPLLSAGGSPGAGPAGPVLSDDDDDDDDDKPVARPLFKPLFELPEGLEFDDPGVAGLVQTPEGRELLSWLVDNDINVVVNNAEVTSYSPGNDTITLGRYADEWSLIHEASHARWDVDGHLVDITEVSQEEYVASQMDNEVEAMSQEVYYYLATEPDITLGPEEQHIIDYQEAFDAAFDGGASETEADAAGREAILALYESGFFDTTWQGETVTYPEFFSETWEDRN